MEDRFDDAEILSLADDLRGFLNSPASRALDVIGGVLLQENLEKNLAEEEKPREYYRGYRDGLPSTFDEARRICEKALEIKNRKP